MVTGAKGSSRVPRGAPRAPHRNTPVPAALRGRTVRSAPRSAPKPKSLAKPKSKKPQKVAPTYAPGRATQGRRLAVAYDLEGPKVRLGVLWAVALFIALGLGRLAFGLPLLGLLLAGVAAVAAVQIIDAWDAQRHRLVRTVAAVGAAGVGFSAAFGARALGATILMTVGGALFVGAVRATRRAPMLATTALVGQAALPVGLSVACVQLSFEYDIGAGVVLLFMVLAFDMADFVVGSGAASIIEGPLAGAVAIALVAAVCAVIQAPPFDGTAVWAFAALAMVLCPAGQVLASWLLPDGSTRANALRRLDSLLVLAPVWTLLVGVLIASR